MELLHFLFYSITFFISLLALLQAMIFSFKKINPSYSSFSRSKSSCHQRLPPSPMSLPIIGHTHLVDPFAAYKSFNKLSTQYGPLIYLRLGSVQCIVASSPEIAKELLMTNDLTFTSRPLPIHVQNLSYNSTFSFAPYGPYWRFMRKLCVSTLLTGQALSQFMHIPKDEIQRLVKFLVKKSNHNETINLSKEITKLANNVVSRMMLSVNYSGGKGTGNEDDQTGELHTLVREVTEITGHFSLSDSFWFLRNVDLQGLVKRATDIRQRHDCSMERIIKERETVRSKRKNDKEKVVTTSSTTSNDQGVVGNNDEVKDILDILLDLSEDEKSEIKVTRQNIKAFVLDIFTGADTAAGAIEWTLAELINHPDMLKKAREEIDSVVGHSRLVEESDLPNLPYLEAVVKESLRLHPPGPMLARESIQDCKIAGYHVPAKTKLFVNIWSINRNPKYWKDPLEFKPERFMKDAGEAEDYEASEVIMKDVKGQHFDLLPFGSGRRGCPGIRLSLLVVPVVLATLIQCFEWTVVGNNSVIDMTERPGLAVPKAQPLMLVPTTRLHNCPFTTTL